MVLAEFDYDISRSPLMDAEDCGFVPRSRSQFHDAANLIGTMLLATSGVQRVAHLERHLRRVVRHREPVAGVAMAQAVLFPLERRQGSPRAFVAFMAVVANASARQTGRL